MQQCWCTYCEARILDGLSPVDDAGKPLVSFIKAPLGDVEGVLPVSFGEYSLDDGEHPGDGFRNFFEYAVKNDAMKEHMVQYFTTHFEIDGRAPRAPSIGQLSEAECRQFYKDLWLKSLGAHQLVAHNHVTGETTPLLWEKNGKIYADPRLQTLFDPIPA